LRRGSRTGWQTRPIGRDVNVHRRDLLSAGRTAECVAPGRSTARTAFGVDAGRNCDKRTEPGDGNNEAASTRRRKRASQCA
jgi:hypothetical protein